MHLRLAVSKLLLSKCMEMAHVPFFMAIFQAHIRLGACTLEKKVSSAGTIWVDESECTCSSLSRRVPAKVNCANLEERF